MLLDHIHLRPVALGFGFVAVIALSLTALVVALTRTADANHGFPDVPTDSAFHDEVSWLTDPRHQVATGFPSGNFDPQSSIKRQQAAFWFANYNATFELVENTLNPGLSNAFQVTIPCPAGKRAVAGGGNINVADVYLTASYPVTASQWRVRYEGDGNLAQDPSFVSGWALCMAEDVG